jgi:hypothetical protein
MSPACPRRRLVESDQLLALQEPPKAPVLDKSPTPTEKSSRPDGVEVVKYRPDNPLLVGLDLLNQVRGPAEFVYDQLNTVYTFRKLS